jgi:hypothetical protein
MKLGMMWWTKRSPTRRKGVEKWLHQQRKKEGWKMPVKR